MYHMRTPSLKSPSHSRNNSRDTLTGHFMNPRTTIRSRPSCRLGYKSMSIKLADPQDSTNIELYLPQSNLDK
jgi:hypothetical protein